MKNFFSFVSITLAITLYLGMYHTAQARDQIRIVGSSTVYPFSAIVAENFAKSSDYKSPVIETTGTGGGFKLFCAGVGTQYADINNASRAIKSGEIEKCKKNNVTFEEIQIGFDGIVIGSSRAKDPIKLQLKEIYMALAKKLPDEHGNFILNPYKKWRQINPDLPNIPIKVLGPPPTSGTRDAFLELVMEAGAHSIKSLALLEKSDPKIFKEHANTLREDGSFIEAGENDNLIVQKLKADTNLLGIFGFSFLEQNFDIIQGSIIEGAKPTFENILDKSYPIARPLFFYVKTAHIHEIRGLKEFVLEFISNRAIDEDGYLLDAGLIPLEEAALLKLRNHVEAL